MIDLLKPVWWIIAIIAILLIAIVWVFAFILQWIGDKRLDYFGLFRKDGKDKK